jgi:hypothetical protein
MIQGMNLLRNPRLWRFFNVYRVITALGCIAAAALVLTTPVRLPDPDDWANYLGVRNFAEGELTIDGYTMYREMMDVNRQGGILLQYLMVKPNRFALEKAPGAVFYLVPFYKAGIVRWGNIVLMLGTVLVTYLLLKRLRDEKAAMTGGLLTAFSPLALVMLNRIYMDTYPSLAFLVIGAGLYLYHHLERPRLKRWPGGLLLFFAFFFICYSVFTRYTNAPVAIVLGLHWVITRTLDWRQGRGKAGREIVPVLLGIALPVAALLVYDKLVFGSPWTYSYALSPYPIKFAFQYLGQLDPFGRPIASQILLYNGQGYVRNLLLGFPLLIIGIPGLVFLLYQKIFRRKADPAGRWASLGVELPWHLVWLLLGWLAGVFGLYWGYEWTAGIVKGGGMVIFCRFLLPGLFPCVIIAALTLARFPWKAVIPLLVLLVAFGAMFYLQWNNEKLHILPDWVTYRTLDSRWPGHGFAPWTKWELEYGNTGIYRGRP